MSPRPTPRARRSRAGGRPRLAGGLLLGAALVAGALLRGWVLFHSSGLTMDSPLYVLMAEQWGHAREPLGPAHHGYSALVALASLGVPGREWPGRIVSLAAGLLLIAVTWRLARGLLPARAAAAAAALVALHPLLALSSGAVMTESTFQCLTYLALLVLAGGRPAWGGGLLGLAYCVRPEAMVVAAAALPAVSPLKRRAVWLLAFALAALPEVAMLSAEHHALTLTPKTNLVAAAGATQDDAEWHATGAESLAAVPASPALARLGTALARAAARYPDRLKGQLKRVHQTWPAPLLLLSLIGMVIRPGPLLAPLAILPVLPLLGVTPHLRYPQTMVPALAIFAAIGGAWLVGRLDPGRTRARGLARGALALVLALGLGWCWRGPAGDALRRSEDGPTRAYRKAGRWLAEHGKPGALVMDRKPYIPFFAGMPQALMPDDDYDALVDYAVRRGADYLVVEEYVMWTIRKQFIPLMTDPAFRARERRLRMIYFGREGPRTGIAIFEVTRAR